MLLAFFAGAGAGDQFTDGDRDLAGEGGACFLGSGSGDPDADLDEETLLAGCGLRDSFLLFFSSGVLDTLLMGRVGEDDSCLL